MPAICGHTLANLTVLTFLSSPTLSQKCIYYAFVDIVVMYIKTVGQMVKDISYLYLAMYNTVFETFLDQFPSFSLQRAIRHWPCQMYKSIYCMTSNKSTQTNLENISI